MNTIITLGKLLFIIPFAIFGFLHFGPLEFCLPVVPTWLPFKAFWVYFTGVCLFSFAVSALIGKLDKLASLLLAILLLTFVFSYHFPKAISGNFEGIISTARDICMAGASLLYGAFVAKDSTYVNAIFSK